MLLSGWMLNSAGCQEQTQSLVSATGGAVRRFYCRRKNETN